MAPKKTKTPAKRTPTKAKPASPRGGRPPRFTTKQVGKALVNSDGFVYLAAQALKCHANTVFNYLKRDEDLKAIVAQKRGEMVDTAERQLRKAILAGESWAICFFLKTQAKDRGYTERNEVTGANGGPIETRDGATVEERADRVAALLDAARTRRALRPAGGGSAAVVAAGRPADDGVRE